MNLNRDLYERARARIPGGTQLLSKRPEMFAPGQGPAYYRRARGVEIEDVDGRTWIDVSIGSVGACALGYADPDVEAAVIEAVRAGSMATLNCPEEVELADLLCELHPWAEQVRFTRSGGEAMAVAVRIARAATGRDVIVFCGYHGWHDWYLAANLGDGDSLDGHLLPGLDPAGVPRGLAGTALPFVHGDREAFDAAIAKAGDRLAAVVMEPMRKSVPPAGFLEHVRDVTARRGGVLVFDEITAGFRREIGGVHLGLGVEPDVAVFGKALGNGFPIAAIIGRRSVMDAAQRSFISSTNWTDRVGPAAALATLRKMRELRLPEHLEAAGIAMQAGWRATAARHGLRVSVGGMPALSAFAFDHGAESRAMATLYTQFMLDAGYLASGAFYAMFPHDGAVVARALEATDVAMAGVRAALDRGVVEATLRGPVSHGGFRRLT